MSALDNALRLAAAEIPVFPCGGNKRPTLEGGFHRASHDTDIVQALWRDHPGQLIGVPTGPASGFDVLDIDPKNEGLAWWAKHQASIPPTRIHRTRSGGLHVLFRAYPAVRNSQSQIAPGVDTRGTGGYIIWWPAAGCEVISAAPIVPWPARLLQVYLKATQPPPVVRRTAAKRRAARDWTVQTARDMADRAIARVRHASPGERHYRLRAAAVTIGGLLDLADLDRGSVCSQLVNAAADAGGEDIKAAAETAEWGLKVGAATPWAERKSTHGR